MVIYKKYRRHNRGSILFVLKSFVAAIKFRSLRDGKVCRLNQMNELFDFFDFWRDAVFFNYFCILVAVELVKS